ncbi:hypothetical protein KXD40_006057 [Peronospora effusa]|uniref:RxLR effector protein n=1 Tax=Peronospora effusa TaxID=542832 RepID=A0A425CK75_9STRA|nr:hypothetical protein DD237_001406 [Peronospora effusa]UIZ25697.1 hypothetical protein KXD40_006057 [Peronospora effusa]
MRLDSIFFVAVLFACFNLTSISVVSITFKAPAHEFDVETAKEERTSSIPVFDTVIKKIKSMTSSGMEEMADVNNMLDVYKTLQRQKGILSHNERYNDGIRYLERTSLDTLKAELESSGNDGDKIFLKVLITFMKENADESIQNKLKTTLLTFWDDKDRSVHDVFKLLKLDHKTNDKVYSNLLKCGSSIREVVTLR